MKHKLMMVKEERIVQEQEGGGVSPSGGSSAPPPPSSGKNTMVGFDDHLVRIMDELTGHKSDLQVLSIVGMGGIGKTTLARNVFDNPYIVNYFHIRIWITISQEFSSQELLLGILRQIGVLSGWENKESNGSLAELGQVLYKNLFGRRYLIVMDDMWSSKAWDDLKKFFPDNKNGSRVMVTTRLSNVAVSLGPEKPYSMDLLDEDNSWNLFCEKAFAQEGCPPELEEIGKDIAKNCKGLPLAIVVIGGLLSKSDMTLKYWESVAQNVNSLVNSRDEQHCLKILSLSYDHLPIHLKPCFLHMGTFPEDDEILVSQLIKFWAAEGFLKPIKGKTLEEVAKEYLEDLIDRNLILILKLGPTTTKIRSCSIHDLLRDLCVRESQKERFYCVAKVQRFRTTLLAPDYKNTCSLCSHPNASRTRIYLPQVVLGWKPTPLSCCSVCNKCRSMHPLRNRLRLVRVIDSCNLHSSVVYLQPTKLRYLRLKAWREFQFVFDSLPLLWNLQTLILDSFKDVIVLPSQIWEMRQLRHLVIDEAVFPDIPLEIRGKEDFAILENLQSLSNIINLRCSDEVLERIPNVKKLRIYYYNDDDSYYYYSIHNLSKLHKLKSLFLHCKFIVLKKMSFSDCLRKLSLSECRIPWEEMTIIGSLPNLEVLRLYSYAFVGAEWNPVEGEFVRLKLLMIWDSDLVWWRAENIHFPNLESVILRNMFSLKEIPLSIGEIETLRLIRLICCTDSAVKSAREIVEEQLGFGNESIHIFITNDEWKTRRVGVS